MISGVEEESKRGKEEGGGGGIAKYIHIAARCTQSGATRYIARSDLAH